MGNYVFDADALREAVTARRRRLEDSKHDMGGDIVPCVRRPRRGRRLRLQGQRRARAPTTATAATGATSGRWAPTTTPTWTSSRPLPVFNLYNHAVADLHQLRPAAAGQAGRGRRRRAGHAPSTRSSRPGVVVTGGSVSKSVLSPALPRRDSGPRCRTRCCSPASRSAPGRWSATRSSTRTSSSRPGPRSASTPRPTARAASSSRTA